jgi:hypothetical protein
MAIEMSFSAFEFAARAASNYKEEKIAFLKLVQGDADKPSELYRGITRMLEKYVEHTRVRAGDRWSHEEARHVSSIWLAHAVFILAGLYVMYGKTLPRIRPGLVEKMEQDCDIPEKMYAWKVLLETFGEMSKRWVGNFLELVSDESSPFYICGHGVAYIFVLSTVFIHAMEDTSDDVLLSEADRLDVASHVARMHPSLKNALEGVLEEMKF